jgi:hypothetical protein
LKGVTVNKWLELIVVVAIILVVGSFAGAGIGLIAAVLVMPWLLIWDRTRRCFGRA